MKKNRGWEKHPRSLGTAHFKYEVEDERNGLEGSDLDEVNQISLCVRAPADAKYMIVQ